jgi:hypothetical protein
VDPKYPWGVGFGSVADVGTPRRAIRFVPQLLTFPADLNVVEYVGQLAPGYPLESLFTACVLPTERELSDLNCAKQAVTIADF